MTTLGPRSTRIGCVWCANTASMQVPAHQVPTMSWSRRWMARSRDQQMIWCQNTAALPPRRKLHTYTQPCVPHLRAEHDACCSMCVARCCSLAPLRQPLLPSTPRSVHSSAVPLLLWPQLMLCSMGGQERTVGEAAGGKRYLGTTPQVSAAASPAVDSSFNVDPPDPSRTFDPSAHVLQDATSQALSEGVQVRPPPGLYTGAGGPGTS